VSGQATERPKLSKKNTCVSVRAVPELNVEGEAHFSHPPKQKHLTNKKNIIT
jgi:hypothetical protein